ncbi:MAG: glucose 1-dehydrogenase [Deltaproteobacteria bacterium]
MRAIAVTIGQKGSARLIEAPEPSAGAGQVKVSVLRVGICGTDAEIDRGEYGEAPAGQPYLILGHENLGRVSAVGAGVTGLGVGDLVVSSVRRPDDCPECRQGQQDMCTKGDYTEHGIKGLNGFMADFYVERPEYLVKLPESLAAAGVLLEPLTVVEKGVREAFRIQERMREWRPKRALILGAGPVGLLGALLTRLRGIETVVYGRDPSDLLAERTKVIGASYVASLDAKGKEAAPLASLAERYGPFDLLLEATGSAEVAVGAMGLIGLNGVLCLASVTGGESMMRISPAHLNMELVMGNRVVFGTVNANQVDYQAGVGHLAEAAKRWPGWLESLVTRKVPLERVREAFERRPADIKTVLELRPA